VVVSNFLLVSAVCVRTVEGGCNIWKKCSVIL
jgi:hypothetical protein